MKKISIALISIICMICTIALSACSSEKAKKYSYSPLNAKVRYLTNIAGETISLSSGREVISENTVFMTEEAMEGDILTEPTEHPTRVGYDFCGWALDKEGEQLFDFSTPITGSLNLYAKWERTQESETVLDYTEPRLQFTEVIDESSEFSLTGVCNQPIKDDAVGLTTAGINRLTAKAQNVKEYLNYTRASATAIQSAMYENGVVSVTYTTGGSNTTIQVTVNDITSTLAITDDPATPKESIDESTFERKALRYEATDIASYNVILGGSSSMENWSNSTEYMNPVTTKNVGIGGSASFHWLNSLADRLIIPYNPRTVVLYVGINDIINFKKNGKTTGENLIKLFEYLHERLPEAHVHFILINHVPGYYKTYKSYIDTANNMVLEYAQTHEYLKTIDAGTVLEKKNGEYSEAYFLTDKLHMSQAGYVLWGAEVKKAVIADDKERYDND
ncbi:MAG TPA: hypothetical protein DIC18_03495 [Clostridiales bacterium]|nr:hypothetical protein [Clostridiales bacterium]